MLTYIHHIQAWRDTQEKAKLFPPPPVSQKYMLDETYIPEKRFSSTSIVVENSDCLEVSAFLSDLELRPLVLCLADPTTPEGDVTKGGGGQIESIYRRSNYCETLPTLSPFFPLESTEVVYSPGITVFKSVEKLDYQEIPPFQIDLVACVGIEFPSLQNGDLQTLDKQLLEKKIETIFQVAAKNGHLSLVLGPLGCGSLGNTARSVALAFQRVLTKWDRVFQKVVFACLTFEKGTFLSLESKKNMSLVNHTIFSVVFR